MQNLKKLSALYQLSNFFTLSDPTISFLLELVSDTHWFYNTERPEGPARSTS